MSTRPGTLVHHMNHNEAQPPYGRQVSEHRRTTSKPLNFKQAMSDFQVMFPEIDRHVIETVLRANNGVVQSTIDQLLILQESSSNELTMREDGIDFPELPTYESSIGNGEEPPPAYSSVWEETPATTGKTDSDKLINSETIKRQSLLIANSYWKAPMLGKLPNDFLRIEVSSKTVDNSTTQSSRPQLCSSPTNEFLTDEENSSISDDERLAIFLQNEEFLRELRRNQEFVSSLEADHRRAIMGSGGVAAAPAGTAVPPVDSVPAVESVSSGGARPRTTPALDDAAFKQKLKHMGKSTKKKFSKLAKKFSRRNPGIRNQFMHASDSTFNLLENNDEPEYVEEGLDGIQEEEDDDDDDMTNENIDKNQQHTKSSAESHLPKVSGTGRQIQQTSGDTGRQLPHPPGAAKAGNIEPIVFYDEDNEFTYKNE